MRILHCLSQRPEATGSGVYIQALINQAASKGHINALLAGIPLGDDPETPHIADEHRHFVTFEGGDLPHAVVGMSDVMPYSSSRFCDLTLDEIVEYESVFIKAIERAISTFQPDLIHSHHLWLKSALVKKHFPEIPQVISCHGSDLRQFQNVVSLRERVLAGTRQVDAVLALSEVQRESIFELHGISREKIHIIGGGYNTEMFLAGEKPTTGPVQLVYAGKLSRAKGVVYLLRALQQLTDIDWHLHLIGGGSGAERDEVVSVAKTLGERVTIYGFVDQDKLIECYQLGHVFILPSFFEGLPLVLLEALASGCRIISTALPGVVELFGDKVETDAVSLVALPRLINVDQPLGEDEDSFVTGLRVVLQGQISAARKYPQIDLEKYQHLIRKYSWNSIFERVEQVYAKLLPAAYDQDDSSVRD